jgi:iron complex outermembrane receptor protein
MSEIKISYVHAIELENQQALLEIPPLNINYAIDLKKGDWNFRLNLNYTAPQWNAPQVIEPINFQNSNIEIDPEQLFDFMTPPDGYFLMGGSVRYQQKRWHAEFKINNLLNSSYRLNTDRLRYFADSPGRNLSIALEYKF